MKPLAFSLLADENIHPAVVDELRRDGKRVESVVELGLAGKSDRDVLRFAHERAWVVVTHDGDFGRLAVRAGDPFTGIVYLRPGHIRPEFVLGILAAIDSTTSDVTPPFVVIAVRRGDGVKVRVRGRGS